MKDAVGVVMFALVVVVVMSAMLVVMVSVEVDV